jgi:hypothetical protein
MRRSARRLCSHTRRHQCRCCGCVTRRVMLSSNGSTDLDSTRLSSTPRIHNQTEEIPAEVELVVIIRPTRRRIIAPPNTREFWRPRENGHPRRMLVVVLRHFRVPRVLGIGSTRAFAQKTTAAPRIANNGSEAHGVKLFAGPPHGEDAHFAGKPNDRGAILALQDGSFWRGDSFGADASVSGEGVFYTGMCGYPGLLSVRACVVQPMITQLSTRRRNVY